jgi:hypothetical protein
MINLVAVTTVIALVGALALRDRGIDHSTGTSAGIWQVSQGQVDAVRTALEPGARLLVAQPSASWFEFALPSMPVFIDSRIEIFPPGVWSDYMAVVRGDAGWRGILDDRQIDAVVTDLYTEGLRDRMDEEPGWRRLYADAAGVVFVRSPA